MYESKRNTGEPTYVLSQIKHIFIGLLTTVVLKTDFVRGLRLYEVSHVRAFTWNVL